MAGSTEPLRALPSPGLDPHRNGGQGPELHPDLLLAASASPHVGLVLNLM